MSRDKQPGYRRGFATARKSLTLLTADSGTQRIADADPVVMLLLV